MIEMDYLFFVHTNLNFILKFSKHIPDFNTGLSPKRISPGLDKASRVRFKRQPCLRQAGSFTRFIFFILFLMVLNSTFVFALIYDQPGLAGIIISPS